MPTLAELYVATRTRNVEDADTDDSPKLVVKRGSNIVFTEKLLGGNSQFARAAGGITRFDLKGRNLDSANLTFEIQASGDDAWSPEHVIIWGISGRVGDERVIPLAAFLDLATPVTPAADGRWLSTDSSEGDSLLAIPSVGRGSNSTRARRVIVVCATDPYGGMFSGSQGPGGSLEDTGSASYVTLQGGGAGRLFLSYTLPSTPQADLGHGAGAFYIVDLAAPFGRGDLTGGAFTLTIQADDWWVPDYFAVFGVDTVIGGPKVLIPFVAASAFELKRMSSDPSEGVHSFVLPTAKVLPAFTRPGEAVDPNEVGGVLASRGRARPKKRKSGATKTAKSKVKPKRRR
ncbi:MAG: hypothetical protein ABI821_16175 [Pseudomonadota bacterium]